MTEQFKPPPQSLEERVAQLETSFSTLARLMLESDKIIVAQNDEMKNMVRLIKQMADSMKEFASELRKVLTP